MADRHLQHLFIDAGREVLLDLCDVARFNGWSRAGVAGGHVPGAVRVAPTWLAEPRGRAWVDRRLSGRRPLLLGSDADVAAAAAQLPDAERVHGEWSEWRGPRAALACKERLMPASEIAADAFDLVEACDSEDAEPDSAHVPGARRLDMHLLEGPPDWNAKPVGMLRRSLERLGLTGRPVVVYGRDPMAAARCGVILIHAGLPDVRLLDGGWSAWVAAGGTVESAWRSMRTKALPSGAATDSPFATFDDVRALVADGHADRLVSIRSLAEHRGEVSGYPWIPAKGDLPGVRWGHAAHPESFSDAFRDPEGCATPFLTEASWHRAGIDAALSPVFYCGTGWRAAETWFTASALGWSATLYDGGWLEWSSRQP